ncbi:hypothetical protein BY996DRAFT_6494766 [Phakopsora pachyrhizi]|nr:hypothetical protein BY996DRAFT_6494766 [Phakopsora pachyrhizi]
MTDKTRKLHHKGLLPFLTLSIVNRRRRGMRRLGGSESRNGNFRIKTTTSLVVEDDVEEDVDILEEEPEKLELVVGFERRPGGLDPGKAGAPVGIQVEVGLVTSLWPGTGQPPSRVEGIRDVAVRILTGSATGMVSAKRVVHMPVAEQRFEKTFLPTIEAIRYSSDSYSLLLRIGGDLARVTGDRLTVAPNTGFSFLPMEAMTSVVRMSKTERSAEVVDVCRWMSFGGDRRYGRLSTEQDKVFTLPMEGMDTADGGFVLAQSGDWSATVKAHRGKFIFEGYEGHCQGHLEDGGDGEGTAAAVQQQRTEEDSVRWLAGSEACGTRLKPSTGQIKI